MKIAILGTRGIPNYYGGFEQCAQYLALGLVQKGHEVLVYNSHDHPYTKEEWHGVQIKHCYDPEDRLGTAGQFIYDMNCILDLRKRKFDVILQMGYTSSSVWGWLLPSDTVVTTNMDGLEWKRTKYSKKVSKFLRWAENLAIKYSDHLISDSEGIKDYIQQKYSKESTFIPYGADIFKQPDLRVLEDHGLVPFSYDMLVARLEPENSIEIILDGVVKSGCLRPFLVIGKHETKYGEYLKTKFSVCKNIQFLGGLYDMIKLDSIRYYSNVYFHGHTVGGTNPSLLEAMASNSLVCANNNSFNRYILGADGLYFSDADDVAKVLVEADKRKEVYQVMLNDNIHKLESIYTWDKIVDQYEKHFESIAGVVLRNK
jgi:glycosyltransferase involved in cell wall biosynthesis